jgi:D-sedoheptulose 7-phosphate isomerase
VFIGLSTSGRSPNILAALLTARATGLVTVGFTGADSDLMSKHCDIVLNAPSKRTPVIQQLHITAAHIICGLAERALHPKS